MPTKIIYDVPQKRQQVNEAQKYYYIRYAAMALKAVAWAVLVLGVIGSLVWGLSIGGTGGGLRIVLGMVATFLAWLALIASRELLLLLMDVKKNTLKSAERITKQSD
jgi:hypothetical protein